MEQHQFAQTLEQATKEVVALTRQYILETFPSAVAYRVWNPATLSFGEYQTTDQILDTYGKDGTVPEWITVLVGAVHQKTTILHLTCASNRINPCSAEWLATWSRLSEEVRILMPFYLRLPAPPKAWRVFTDGLPDMPRSAAENGKYWLPHLRRNSGNGSNHDAGTDRKKAAERLP